MPPKVTTVGVEKLVSSQPSAPDDPIAKEKPDKKFFLAFDFNKVDSLVYNHPKLYPLKYDAPADTDMFLPQVNHITFRLPSAPPLSQPYDVQKVSRII